MGVIMRQPRRRNLPPLGNWLPRGSAPTIRTHSNSQCRRGARCPDGGTMRGKGLALSAIAIALVMAGTQWPVVEADGAAALVGTVTAPDEGKMEGVVVTAR